MKSLLLVISTLLPFLSFSSSYFLSSENFKCHDFTLFLNKKMNTNLPKEIVTKFTINKEERIKKTKKNFKEGDIVQDRYLETINAFYENKLVKWYLAARKSPSSVNSVNEKFRQLKKNNINNSLVDDEKIIYWWIAEDHFCFTGETVPLEILLDLKVTYSISTNGYLNRFNNGNNVEKEWIINFFLKLDSLGRYEASQSSNTCAYTSMQTHLFYAYILSCIDWDSKSTDFIENHQNELLKKIFRSLYKNYSTVYGNPDIINFMQNNPKLGIPLGYFLPLKIHSTINNYLIELLNRTKTHIQYLNEYLK